MQLTELSLNRYLYKENQTVETQDASVVSASSLPADVASVPAGGAAQDINTGNVTINGSQLTPGTIPQTTLDVSNWGWGQTCAFSVASATQVNWGSGTFKSANGVVYNISAGNTGTMSAKTYIYLDLNVSLTAYQITTTSATSVGIGKVLVAVAQNGATAATYNLSEANQIVGDNILANSIDASKITTGQLVVGTNVGQGTAVTSSGVTTIIGNTVTTGYVNALSVIAGSVAAENITGTTITGKTIVGSTLSTATSGQRTVLTATTQDFYNSNNEQIGMVYANATGNGGLVISSVKSGSNIYLWPGSSGIINIGNGIAGGILIDYANSAIYPGTTSGYDLGVITKHWRDIWNSGVHIYNGIDQPVIIHGIVSGGSILYDNTPGWSCSNIATGRYTITHNLGTYYYSIQVTPQASTVKNITIESYTSNAFTVRIANLSDTLENNDFFFNVSVDPAYI